MFGAVKKNTKEWNEKANAEVIYCGARFLALNSDKNCCGICSALEMSALHLCIIDNIKKIKLSSCNLDKRFFIRLLFNKTCSRKELTGVMEIIYSSIQGRKGLALSGQDYHRTSENHYVVGWICWLHNSWVMNQDLSVVVLAEHFTWPRYLEGDPLSPPPSGDT